MHVLDTRHGSMLVRRGTDLISQKLFQNGEFDWYVVELCKQFAIKAETGTILDIGANIGTVTVPLAKSFPHYTIHAFEPQKHVFNQLAGNVALNDLYNVELHMMALGERNEIVEIDLPIYGVNTNVGAWSMSEEVRKNNPESKAGGQMQKIQVSTLDYFRFDKPVRLIKMDVEGMELSVLFGSTNFLISHNYPPIIYECWANQPWFEESARKLNSYVESLGYSLNRLQNTVIAERIRNEKV